MEIIVDHKREFRIGLLYLLCAIITAVMFYLLREQFVSTAPLYIIVLAEFLLTAWMLIKGKTYEKLNAEGITVTAPLKTATYSWQQVQQYGIDLVPVQRGSKVYLAQKEPVISVVTDTRKLKLPYREDVLQCLSHYKGAAAYDKRQ